VSEKVLRIRDFLSRIQGTDPNFFSSQVPDPDPNIFSSRINEKLYANFRFFASYAFRSKVLVFVTVEKIRDPYTGIQAPEKNSSRIWFLDPGGKKAPDPGSTKLVGDKDPVKYLF
jgi:hypothetical protein